VKTHRYIELSCPDGFVLHDVTIGRFYDGSGFAGEFCDHISDGAANGCDAASERFTALCAGQTSCSFFANQPMLEEYECGRNNTSSVFSHATCTLEPIFGVDSYFTEWSALSWGAARAAISREQNEIKNVLENVLE
jgi:hypothetical protein